MADNTTSSLLRLEQQDTKTKKLKSNRLIDMHILSEISTPLKKKVKAVSPLAKRDYTCSDMKPPSKTTQELLK